MSRLSIRIVIMFAPDNFYVTLPSGSDNVFYPHNTVTQYTTHLSQVIDFDDHKFEAAIVEFQLRAKLFSLNKESTLLYILIEITNEEYILRFEEDSHVSRLINLITDSVHTVTFVTYPDADDHLDMHITVNLASGSYNNINDLIECINSLLGHSTKSDLLYFQITDTNYLSLNGSFISGRKFSVIATDDFKKLLLLDKKNEKPIIDNNKKLKINDGLFKNLNNDFGEILIYSDILEHSYIGNTCGQLLRTISAFPDNLELKKSIIFDTPHYIPVIRSRINTTTLELRSLNGDYYPINEGHCIVKLHFRKSEI